jgi:hypothetical protein
MKGKVAVITEKAVKPLPCISSRCGTATDYLNLCFVLASFLKMRGV